MRCESQVSSPRPELPDVPGQGSSPGRSIRVLADERTSH